eukprot:1158786-Pelagomonas_calceolata.AAC.16
MHTFLQSTLVQGRGKRRSHIEGGSHHLTHALESVARIRCPPEAVLKPAGLPPCWTCRSSGSLHRAKASVMRMICGANENGGSVVLWGAIQMGISKRECFFGPHQELSSLNKGEPFSIACIHPYLFSNNVQGPRSPSLVLHHKCCALRHDDLCALCLCVGIWRLCCASQPPLPKSMLTKLTPQAWAAAWERGACAVMWDGALHR